MAITKIIQPTMIETTDEQMGLTINNGDFEALKRVKDLYGLKDEEAVIAFALGILTQSNGQGVTITKENGLPARLIPSDDLKG